MTKKKYQESGFGKYNVSGTVEEPKIVPDGESIEKITGRETFKTLYNNLTTQTNTRVMSDAETELILVDYFTQSQYGRNGTAISKEKPIEETPTPEVEETEEIDTTPTPEIEEIPEGLKTSTGNKYGIYNLLDDGYKVYYLPK